MVEIRTRARRGGAGCMLVFGLPFLGVGIGAGYLVGSTLLTWHAMSQWVETPAYIEHAALETHRGTDSTTYSVDARYRYEYGGQTYRSTRVAISSMSDNMGKYHENVANELEQYEGTQTPYRCLVNPDAPGEAVLYRDIRWGLIGVGSIFMVVFGGFGFALVTGPLFGRKAAKQRAAIKEANPNAPWMWRPGWASGVIHSDRRGGAWAMFLVAIFWNGIALPIGYLVVREVFVKGESALVLLALIFPVVGILMIVYAVYLTIQRQRYGDPVFRMAETPGVVGGKLSGVIEVPRKVRAEQGFRLKLQCVRRRTTGSGKHRSTSEDVLWEDDRIMARELLDERSASTSIPVAFGIPYEAEESAPARSDNFVLWRLLASAATPGVDFSAQFEVPVFRTEASSPDFVLDESALSGYVAERNVLQEITDAGIRVTPTAGDGLRIGFPMARRVGAALMVTVIFFIFGGVSVGLFFTDASILFPIVFSLFSVLIGWAALDAWLAKYDLDVRRNEITFTGGLLGRSGPHTYTLDEISDIEVKKSSSQGNTVYYSLQLKDTSEKTHILCKDLEGRAQAEMLKETIMGILQGTHDVA